MSTQDYKTKSEIIERRLPRINGNNQYKSKTIVALDGGYSSVKGVSPNKVFKFPSYAKKAPETLEAMTKVDPADILFRNDNTGEVWVVGRTAEILMEQRDIDSMTDASLYTRYRYDSDIFKVIMIAGVALGLLATGKTDEVFLQTGLPATYKERDEEKIKKALAGSYRVSIKVGNNPWAALAFDLPESNIGVMEQPQGTLCSCIYSNGELSPEGKKILQSKGTIILDIGFGTEDIFSTKGGFKNNHQTYSDTGMRAVFESVTKTLHDQKDIDVKVFELQSSLSSGIISYTDPYTFETEDIEYGSILEAANQELCQKSIQRLMQEYGNLQGYEYLIVTGGTGESRFEQIQQKLGNIRTNGVPLKILPGNLNMPELSCSYSNVMGYYMYRHVQFTAEMKKLGAL